jgi:uncharacterized membrane protein YgcG
MSSARRPGLAPSLARRLLAPLVVALVVLTPAGAAASCTATDAVLGGEDFSSLTSASGCIHAAFATTGPLQVDPGVAAQLDGSASVGDDGVARGGAGLTFAWHFGDEVDPQATTSPDPSPTTSHLYPASRGHYLAWFTVTDASVSPAATSPSSDPLDVYVSEMPIAAFDAPPGTLLPGRAYQFDAGASTAPGGSIDHCEWDWGDGSPIQTTGPGVCSAQHTFAADGSSSAVTLTVVNDVGLRSAPVSHAIVVHDARPLVQLVATPSTVLPEQQLTLSAAGSSDPDGTIAEYRWDLDANGSFETSTGTTPTVTAGPYPNPGVITLRVKAIDDSGGWTVASVAVTVADPHESGSGGSGDVGSSAAGAGSGGSGGAHGSSGSGGSAGAAGERLALGLSGTAIQRLAVVLRRGVSLHASANRSARGTLTLTISSRDARKLRLVGSRRHGPVTIGTLRIRLRSGHPAKPSVRLTRRAGRALRRAHLRRLRVTVRGSIASTSERTGAVRVVLLRG